MGQIPSLVSSGLRFFVTPVGQARERNRKGGRGERQKRDKRKGEGREGETERGKKKERQGGQKGGKEKTCQRLPRPKVSTLGFRT